jgi:hypothetical protein
MYYFRYTEDFIVGVDGSKKDCIYLKNQVKEFLETELKIVVNLKKIEIIHTEREFTKFLGYKIHNMVMKKGIYRHLSQNVPKCILSAPIKDVIKRLFEKNYATKVGNPTRNAKFINHQLVEIIIHYKRIERRILNYFFLASNYENFAAKIHYILKYSCVLTIAFKMKLKTKKKVFKKYGKDLSIRNKKGKIIATYSTISYKRPKKFFKAVKCFIVDFIDKIDMKRRRDNTNFKTLWIIYGSNGDTKIHYVKSLIKRLSKKNFLENKVSMMDRKQVPLCKLCHQSVFFGRYDNNLF